MRVTSAASSQLAPHQGAKRLFWLQRRTTAATADVERGRQLHYQSDHTRTWEVQQQRQQVGKCGTDQRMAGRTDGRTDERTNDNRCAVQCVDSRHCQLALNCAALDCWPKTFPDFHNLEATAQELPQDSIIINYLLLGPFLETPRKILSKPWHRLQTTVETNRTWVYFYIFNSQTVDSDGDTKKFSVAEIF